MSIDKIKLEQDALGIMSKAVGRLLLKYPFYGSLALRLKLVADWACNTAYTNAVVIGFKPTYVIDMYAGNPAHTLFLVAHEVMHVVLKHMLRLEGRNPKIANIAMDHVINLLLKEAGFDVPSCALCDPKYKGMSWERVYGLIYKEIEEQCTCGNDGKSSDDQCESDGEGDSDGDNDCPIHGGTSIEDALRNGEFGEVRPVPVDCDKDVDTIEIEWESAITTAVNKEKSRGTMPGGLIEAIDGRNQPVVDWKETLSAFVSDMGNNFEPTWSRVNRRMMDSGYYFAGMKREGVNDLVIALDTSGSVSNDEIKQFCSEALDILDLFECDVTFIPCDSRVGLVQSFESGDLPDECSDFKVTGRGGTSFAPVFDWVKDNMSVDPTALIYFTDGECSYPDEPDYPVLWGISNGSWFEEAPWGETVKVQL